MYKDILLQKSTIDQQLKLLNQILQTISQLNQQNIVLINTPQIPINPNINYRISTPQIPINCQIIPINCQINKNTEIFRSNSDMTNHNNRNKKSENNKQLKLNKQTLGKHNNANTIVIKKNVNDVDIMIN